MMIRRLAAPAALLLVSGCLASKGDIRLLQEELRATRAQLASGDTSLLRADQARRDQIERTLGEIQHLSDSIRVLSNRLSTFQANANGQFDYMGRQIVQIQALLGQQTRNLQNAQTQLEALREQGQMAAASGGSAPAAPPVPGDTTQPPPPQGPGVATLFLNGRKQVEQGAPALGRNLLQQVVDSFPNDPYAPRAQLYIGESFEDQGNTAAADSVYLVLVKRYPQAPEAATSLYRVGKRLWDANKKAEARPYLNRVVNEYPDSDEARLAKDLLNGRV